MWSLLMNQQVLGRKIHLSTAYHFARGRDIYPIMAISYSMWPRRSKPSDRILKVRLLQPDQMRRMVSSEDFSYCVMCYYLQPWGSCMAYLTVMVHWRILRESGTIWKVSRPKNPGSYFLIAVYAGSSSPSFCSTLRNSWTASMLYVWRPSH